MHLFSKSLLLLLISLKLFATQTEVVHSSVSTYYEHKLYSNSKQKKNGDTFGAGGDIHHSNASYKFAYEFAHANTYQPPMNEDLEVHKLFLQYGYSFNKNFHVRINYINVLNDNIAITTGGQSYGLGLSYKFKDKFSVGLTEYFTNYDDFNVAQTDLKLNYKFSLNDVGIQCTSITKYLLIDEKQMNSFTKNAKDSYLTSGIKIHAHKNSYHMGIGAYFGKRAFSIMNEGFKLQHHAMEFDRTYAIGVGKNISNFVLRFQYIYQRAIELPIKNENVEMQISRLMVNYKF